MDPLDDSSLARQLDPTGLAERIAGLPQQCREAWQQVQAFALPQDYRQVQRVVLAGMGGSGIGGDLLADLAALEQAPPVLVCRDYTLPSYVDRESLVIASSYSGNTEETLALFLQAVERGARTVAITRGGELKRQAEARGVPLLLIPYVGEPRSALGYSFIVPLGLLDRLGLLSPKAEALARALEELERLALAPGLPTAKNPAKQLARELHQRLAVIYSGGFLLGAGRRWKTQINENGKGWAIHEALPELNHNSVAGYAHPQLVQERSYVLLLSSQQHHPRLRLRCRLTAQLLARYGIQHRTVEPPGTTPLSQMLSAVLLGDYVSYYLALLNSVDPSPVPAIDELKEGLR